MAGQAYGLLKKSTTVFKVLAWISLVLQVGSGVAALVIGGEPIPTAFGITMSPRIAGLLAMVQGVISFFILLFVAHLVRLLLDIRCALSKDSSCTG